MNIEENFDTALEFVTNLQKEVGGDKLIYRGIPEEYDSGKILSSSMYRNAQEDSDNIFNEYFSPIDIEKEIVERARRFFKGIIYIAHCPAISAACGVAASGASVPVCGTEAPVW